MKALESGASGRVAGAAAGSHVRGADVSRVRTSAIVHLMVKIAGRTSELTPSGVARLTSCGEILHRVLKTNLQTFSDKFAKQLPVVIYVSEAPRMANLSFPVSCHIRGPFQSCDPGLHGSCDRHISREVRPSPAAVKPSPSTSPALLGCGVGVCEERVTVVGITRTPPTSRLELDAGKEVARARKGVKDGSPED